MRGAIEAGSITVAASQNATEKIGEVNRNEQVVAFQVQPATTAGTSGQKILQLHLNDPTGSDVQYGTLVWSHDQDEIQFSGPGGVPDGTAARDQVSGVLVPVPAGVQLELRFNNNTDAEQTLDYEIALAYRDNNQTPLPISVQ